MAVLFRLIVPGKAGIVKIRRIYGGYTVRAYSLYPLYNVSGCDGVVRLQA